MARKRRSPEPWVLAVALQAAPRLLRERGADPAQVARRTGLALRMLDDPERRIPFAIAGKFLRECAAAARCPHFGLLAGEAAGISALGVVGHLMSNSTTVRAALVNLTAYLHHQESGAGVTLAPENGLCALTYTFHRQDLAGVEEIVDAALGIGTSLMRHLCGEAWAPVAVELGRARPKDTLPYRQVFSSPVRFGAERNALLFDDKLLGLPLRAADPGLRRILEEKIAELDRGHRADYADEVRSVIRGALLAGHASSEEVARRLSITRRTLHRRLQAFEATYESLLDETRFDLARQLLANSRASMIDIAESLDYNNASAFTRAFRRWAGMAPSEWRQRKASS